MTDRPAMICAGCAKKPSEIPEYASDAYRVPTQSPEDYVWDEEGTLDRESGAFLCTDCYIRFGQPSSPRGWRATPRNMADLLGIEL